MTEIVTHLYSEGVVPRHRPRQPYSATTSFVVFRMTDDLVLGLV